MPVRPQAGQARRPRGPPLALVVVCLGALPLLFVLLPLLAPILGTVTEFTGTMLSTDSHNLTFNALLPWIAISFIGAAGFTLFMAVVFFGGDVSAPRRGR